MIALAQLTANEVGSRAFILFLCGCMRVVSDLQWRLNGFLNSRLNSLSSIPLVQCRKRSV